MENNYYIITNPTTNKRLASYYSGTFCSGVKDVFRMKDNEWLVYRKKQDAVEQIERINADLDNWINNSIMIEQLPNWIAVGKEKEFIEQSNKTYNNLKRYVGKLVIKYVE